MEKHGRQRKKADVSAQEALLCTVAGFSLHKLQFTFVVSIESLATSRHFWSFRSETLRNGDCVLEARLGIAPATPAMVLAPPYIQQATQRSVIPGRVAARRMWTVPNNSRPPPRMLALVFTKPWRKDKARAEGSTAEGSWQHPG